MRIKNIEQLALHFHGYRTLQSLDTSDSRRFGIIAVCRSGWKHLGTDDKLVSTLGIMCRSVRRHFGPVPTSALIWQGHFGHKTLILKCLGPELSWDQSVLKSLLGRTALKTVNFKGAHRIFFCGHFSCGRLSSLIPKDK